jgi:hypothetical protein
MGATHIKQRISRKMSSTPGVPSTRRARASESQHQCRWPLKAVQDTLECQFTNAPAGFSFQAQTCSV